MSDTIQKYDLVVSLGGNCAAANSLRFRNKRFYSLPFDWTYFHDKQAIFNFLQGLKTDFSDYLLKENLVSVNEGLHGGYLNYFDKKTLYYFPNHFKKTIDDDVYYNKVYQKFKKRCDRLVTLLNKSKTVLFLLSTKVRIDITDIEKFLADFKILFPSLKVHIRILAFDSEKDEILETNDYVFCKYKRDINEYDYNNTNYEWKFVDNIEISGFDTKGFPKKILSLGLNKYKLKLYLDKNYNVGG